MTATRDRQNGRALHAATTEALRSCAPAVTELGLALRELRAALPPELRGDAERAFMNAFGNAVWAAGRTAG